MKINISHSFFLKTGVAARTPEASARSAQCVLTQLTKLSIQSSRGQHCTAPSYIFTTLENKKILNFEAKRWNRRRGQSQEDHLRMLCNKAGDC